MTEQPIPDEIPADDAAWELEPDDSDPEEGVLSDNVDGDDIEDDDEFVEIDEAAIEDVVA